MELIVFIGIPASGKSSFYKERFFNSHVRVSMDLLNTRKKEAAYLDLGFRLQQRMVVDNTNVTLKDRAVYLQLAKENRYRSIGYFFQSQIADCLERNRQRPKVDRITDKGVMAKHHALELPGLAEGFDELWFVALSENGFNISPWKNEV